MSLGESQLSCGYNSQGVDSALSYSSQLGGYGHASGGSLPLSQGDERAGLSLSQDSASHGYAFSAASQDDPYRFDPWGGHAADAYRYDAHGYDACTQVGYDSQSGYNSQPGA